MVSRNEDDIVREPSIHPRLIDGALIFPERKRYTNALEGSSRRIELLIRRRNPSGLSGWAAYSFGRTRSYDSTRAETYCGDFRSAPRAEPVWRIPGISPRERGRHIPGREQFSKFRDILSLAVTVSAGARNQLRLPYYARLGVRGDRQLEYFGRRLTLFVELLNVLNRPALGLVRGSVNPTTGEAIGFTDSLFGRRPSAGIAVDF